RATCSAWGSRCGDERSRQQLARRPALVVSVFIFSMNANETADQPIEGIRRRSPQCGRTIRVSRHRRAVGALLGESSPCRPVGSPGHSKVVETTPVRCGAVGIAKATGGRAGLSAHTDL